MSTDQQNIDTDDQQPSRSFWEEAWQRFQRRRMAMMSLCFVLILALIALFAPMIAGTKPIVCKYKGSIYFPFMGYYKASWENPIFRVDRIRRRYPKMLSEKDPDSWAIWPLVYQNPYFRVTNKEWGDHSR